MKRHALLCILFCALLIPTGCSRGVNSRRSAYRAVITPEISEFDLDFFANAVALGVTHDGAGFWNLSMTNRLGTAVEIAWDESVYVTTTGISLRLVRDSAPLLMSTYTAQAPSPVAPGSSFQATFTDEQTATHVQLVYVHYYDWLPPPGPPRPIRPDGEARLHIVVRANDARHVWSARVRFEPL